MAERLAPGTPVEWHGGNRPYNEKHSGTVVCFLEPEANSYEKHPALESVGRGHIKFDRWSQNCRYLVAVQKGKHGNLTHYYAPLAKWLES